MGQGKSYERKSIDGERSNKMERKKTWTYGSQKDKPSNNDATKKTLYRNHFAYFFNEQYGNEIIAFINF